MRASGRSAWSECVLTINEESARLSLNRARCGPVACPLKEGQTARHVTIAREMTNASSLQILAGSSSYDRGSAGPDDLLVGQWVPPCLYIQDHI